MRFADPADQGIGPRDYDSAAHPEQEEQENNAAVAFRSRKPEERNGDEREAKNETGLIALGIKQWPHAEGCDHQPQRL